MVSAQDLWAQNFAGVVEQAFSCPPSNCSCQPVTQLCQNAIQRFACEYAFGTCSPQGFRLTARHQVCNELEGACGQNFLSAGLGWLDCRHAYYTGQKVLTDSNNCDIIEGCPPVVVTPEPPVVPRPPRPLPPPGVVIEENSGLSLAAKLGIGLAALLALILLALVAYFAIVSPRVEARNTIAGQGYDVY